MPLYGGVCEKAGGVYLKQRTGTLRVGITAILFALLCRLWAMEGSETWRSFLTQQNIAAFLQYIETGRNVRFSSSQTVFTPDFAESPPPMLPESRQETIPSFSETDDVALYYAVNKTPDIAALLAQPLEWELSTEEPSVLILHTHTTESYTKKGEDYVESSSWRTADENYNMLAIGALVAQILEENGIRTIQDRQMYDYPSYNGSYTRARNAIKTWLEEYPGIRLVLDLHRDASGSEGGQMRTVAEVKGETAAQLMVVLGTNHENYEKNLSLGLKLHAQLETLCSGIMRPLQLRAQRFNQDLCPGALLVEVGAAGNSHAEARLAAQMLAEAVVALSHGTQ